MEDLKQRVGCLHAHHSNIAYVERAFASYEVELVHFVEPGLMRRVSSDPHFSSDDASRKVEEQLSWMSQSDLDVILITCTNYIALAEKAQGSMLRQLSHWMSLYFMRCVMICCHEPWYSRIRLP